MTAGSVGAGGPFGAPPFPRFSAPDYRDVLTLLHRLRQPEWYLEIGTDIGRSLELSSCASIAIDPEFRLAASPIGRKRELHLFQQPSDDAFANPRLKALGAQIDLAFLDGMHRFEFLLRDFMNTEAMMSESGIILLHDVGPWTLRMTTREVPRPDDHRFWTGDVWKMLPVLKQWRPELDVSFLDCTPTGLAMITGPWMENDALSRNYETILHDWVGVELEDYGVARFYKAHSPVPSLDALAQVTSAIVA